MPGRIEELGKGAIDGRLELIHIDVVLADERPDLACAPPRLLFRRQEPVHHGLIPAIASPTAAVRAHTSTGGRP